MTHTYTISNTTANTGTITLNAGARYNNTVTIANLGAGGVGGTGISGPAYHLNSGAGQIYTTIGTGTANWTTPNTQFNNSNGKAIMTVPNGKDEIVLEKDATLTVKGKVVINDRDLEERLTTIEKVLRIPERDVKLEAKHPKLKKLYDEYIKELSKYRMWNTIKGEDDVA